MMQRSVAVSALVESDFAHRDGVGLHQLAQHAGDSLPVLRVLWVKERVVADPRAVKGRHDLGTVFRDHLPDIHAEVLGLGQHGIWVDVDAGQAEHALSARPGGTCRDIGSQVWPGQMTNVQWAIDGGLRDDNDSYAGRFLPHCGSSLLSAGALSGIQ